jgi:toxin ParE1/3/4
MRLIFAPLATADLEEIGDYIAPDKPPRALSFMRELRAQCRKILDNPLAFAARGPGPRSARAANMANT